MDLGGRGGEEGDSCVIYMHHWVGQGSKLNGGSLWVEKGLISCNFPRFAPGEQHRQAWGHGP
jgi:hypothetical protein